MVEHTVHNDLLAPGVAIGHKLPELLVGAQTAVHPAVIDGIIAVGAALEQRADINGRAAQVFGGVLGPGVQLCERARCGLAVVFVRTAAQAQRINVIKNCGIIPCHSYSLPYHFFCRPAAAGSVYHKLCQLCGCLINFLHSLCQNQQV